MNFRPDITVAAVIERAGRFLVVQERIAGQLVLNQPAGHVEEGESLAAAVARETLEESAWEFVPDWLLGVYLWRKPHGGSTLRFAFCGRLGAHQPGRALDEPVVGTDWLTPEQLRARAATLRTPLVLRCIDDYLGGQRIELAAVATLLEL